MPDSPPKIICIVGETATGKTAAAIEAALKFNGEIINADSMQVYRGMDIGTAKPTAQEQARASFHLIDMADPKDTYSAGRFWEDARKAIRDITGRGKLPVVAGGTGLYVKTLTHGLIDAPPFNRLLRDELRATEAADPGYLHRRVGKIDPECASKLSPKDHVRLVRAIEVYEASGMTLSDFQNDHQFGERHYDALKIGLKRDPRKLKERIEARARLMIEQGFEQEVRKLLSEGVAYSDSSMAAVGYRPMIRHIRGEIDIETAIAETIRGSNKLAKRQRTWFRADKEIHWFQMPDENDNMLGRMQAWLRDATQRK